MQSEQFIAQVNQAAPGHNADTVRKATRATIKGLCAYLSKEQKRRFASQLPRELAESAEASAGRTTVGETVGLAAFYEQIAAEADLPREQLADYVRAVTQTLQNSITDGELVDVTFDLPPELNQLIAR